MVELYLRVDEYDIDFNWYGSLWDKHDFTFIQPDIGWLGIHCRKLLSAVGKSTVAWISGA